MLYAPYPLPCALYLKPIVLEEPSNSDLTRRRLFFLDFTGSIQYQNLFTLLNQV
jgi:hypothetical protein